LLQRTARAGVDVTSALVVPGARTATYSAILDHLGDMTVSIDDMEIVRAITPSVLRARADRIRNAASMVVDANLEPATLRQALAIGRRAGVPVCADPVSVDLARRLKSRLCDFAIITPNAAEAAVLCGQPVDTVEQAAEAARRLIACGVGLVVITLAERGLFYASTEGSGHIPAPRVDVVDATGAGDALTAGLLCGLFQGLPVDECMRLGVAAATLTLQTPETVFPALSLERLYESMGA
jgi:pseudouridine kinase